MAKPIGRPFKKKANVTTVARAIPPAPEPPAEPRLYDPMTEEKWRGNLDMVMWWRAVLGQPQGRALVELIRTGVPTASISGGDLATDVLRAAKIAQMHKETEGAMLGMIAGYEKLKDILLNRLTSHIPSAPVRMKSPGQESFSPHNVTPPS